MIWKVLLLALILIGFVVLALGVGIFFTKKKSFPETSISKNKDMQKLKITCAKHDELHACGIDGGCCGSENNNHKDLK
ncbi:MAG: hypothetical protein GX793_02850 [Bacteroidales bacterium]|jgi:uncharacterized protein YpmS|nr:hypothetical protein [Bacteroidales bacterium]MCK9498865.1 hypothetical protein [Bacteroidales bacterium]MDY0314816.1 hypothetical protein [Bacteroidales bacterium]NLB85981.1 hypothetical protein [Bacteroidales bacterium]